MWGLLYFPEEIGTLPVGPVEYSWWWAQSRLAYATLGIRIQLSGLRSWKVILTRCTDKSPWLPIYCLIQVLESLPMDGVHTLQLWSDAGTHFRARHFVWFMGVEVFRKWPKLRRTSLEYFAENHGKGPVDGLFGRLSRTKAEARLRECLVDLPDLKAAYEAAFQLRRQREPNCEVEDFWVLVPEIDKKLFMVPIVRLDSLPVGVTSCYSWSFFSNDERRRTIMGTKAGMRDMVMGITSRAHLLTGKRCADCRTFHCRMEAQPDHDEEALEQEEAADLTHKTRLYRGWKSLIARPSPRRTRPRR